jgi:hypothetical protein
MGRPDTTVLRCKYEEPYGQARCGWLAIRPKAGVDVGALFDALRSEAVAERLSEHARLYGNGLWKLEPRDPRAVTLPPTLAKGLS